MSTACVYAVEPLHTLKDLYFSSLLPGLVRAVLAACASTCQRQVAIVSSAHSIGLTVAVQTARSKLGEVTAWLDKLASLSLCKHKTQKFKPGTTPAWAEPYFEEWSSMLDQCKIECARLQDVISSASVKK
jgi:hypothetical protein